MRSSLGITLILSLLILSLCGVLMTCMDSFDHYAVLAGAVSVPSLVTFFALMLVAFANPFISVHPAAAPALSPLHTRREPDPLWHPLLLAFSDGILHPKVF